MNEIDTVINEVLETISILEEQKDDLEFIEAGGLMQIESEKIKLAALREKRDREADPKPLSLDELRERDGMPVYCVDGANHRCYCLVDADSEDCIDSESGAWCFAFYNMPGGGKHGLHNMGWLAYRSKPNEIIKGE